MDIQGGDLRPGAAAGELVLDEHGSMRLRGCRGLDAAARWNAGFLAGGDDALILSQRLAIPGAGVQVENAAGFGGERWVAWKDPSTVIPGPDGIRMEPTPNRAAGEGGGPAGWTDLPGDVQRAPKRKRNAVGGGEFTGESFDLHHQLWGETPGGGPGEGVLRRRGGSSWRARQVI